MNNRFNLLYFCLLLFGSFQLFSLDQDELYLNKVDLELLEQNPSLQFAYLSDALIEIIVSFCSNNPILQPIFAGQNKINTHLIPSSKAYELMEELAIRVNDSDRQNEAAFQEIKTIFQEYKKLMDSGEVVIGYEAITRSKKRKTFDELFVRCRLIAASLKVCGDVRVCGNVIRADGTILGDTGPTGPTGAIGAIAPTDFLWIYSTFNQFANLAPAQISFNGLGASLGFSFTPTGSVITIPSTGTYLIKFAANAAPTTVAITVRRNLSTVIAGSGSFTSQGAGIVGQSGTLIVSFTAGDTVDFLLESGPVSDGMIQRSPLTANTHSISVTIVRLT